MRKKIQKCIDERNWSGLVFLAESDPRAFFNALTVRLLGIRRMRWVKDIAAARYEEALRIDAAYFILSACNINLALAKEDENY